MEVKRNFKELELNIGDPFCHIRLDGSRGLSVELTEAQTSEWEDLRGRLKVDDSITSSTIDDEIRRDIFTCKHCVLHHSDLVLSTKNTSDAAIGVHMFLLNDFCLITTCMEASAPVDKMLGQEYVIKYALPLDELTYTEVFLPKNPRNSKNHVELQPDKLALKLLHNNVHYTLKAGSSEEKSKWVEELRLAIYSIFVKARDEPPVGWPFLVENSSYMASVFIGDDNLCRYYLNSGKALVNTVGPCGMSALHYAAFNDRPNIIKILLDEYGADVDIVNNAKNTALHLAAAKGHVAVAQILLDYQASIHAKNERGFDPLSMALFYCERERDLEVLVKLFHLKGADLNASSMDEHSSRIHECSRHNLSVAIDVLVGEDADVNARHAQTGLTPLQIACENAVPHPATIKALIANGSLVNIFDGKGRSLIEILLDQYNINLGEQVLSISTGLDDTGRMSEDFESEQIREMVEEAVHALIVGGARVKNIMDKKIRLNYPKRIQRDGDTGNS